MSIATRKLNDLELKEVVDTLDRLHNQARNALIFTGFMVHDESVKELPSVVPDYSVGDFLVFDRKLHPEFKD